MGRRGRPLSPPVDYLPGALPDPDALYARLLAEVAWDDRMRARRTASFGVPYDYSGVAYPHAPWPELLDGPRRVVAERCGFEANNCLLNAYPTGRHAMGFHADDASILADGTGIAVFSLGAARPLRLRRRDDRARTWDVLLEPGSLLVMSRAMQAEWQHALPPADGAGGRISVTLRRLRG